MATAAVAGPLLIIAGAGSGKTNTLAHRVAHLIVNGADPRRILLMTFSRRAAAGDDAARRAHLPREVLGRDAAVAATPDLGRHLPRHRRPAAARLRAEIGLDPAFTIHDREDSADLMNLVRHELGLSQDREPLSGQGHLPCDLFARRQRAGAAGRGAAARRFPWCASWAGRAASGCSRAYVEAKQAQNVLDYDDLLLYWAQMAGRAGARRSRSARASTTCWSTNTRTPTALQASILLGAEARRARADRGRRRRAVDLFVPRRDGAQHPRLSRRSSRRRPRSSRWSATTARPQPILAAANAVIGAGDASASPRTCGPSAARRSGRCWSRCATRPDQAGYVCRAGAGASARPARALKAQAVLFRASHHSGALEIELTRRNIPFVKFGGLKFLEAAHVKDVLAVLRLAENPRDRVAGFRVLQLMPGIGPATRGAGRSTPWRGSARCGDGAGGFRAAAPRRSRLAGLRRPVRSAARSRAGLAGRARAGRGTGTSRISSASTRTPRRARADLVQLEQIAAGYPSRERFLTELTLDPPDATSDRGRAAACSTRTI